jgi:anti-sigma-K factor RskA
MPSSRPGGAAPDRRARTGYADAVPDRSPGGPAWRRALPAALIAAAVAAVIGLGIWNVSLSDSLARTQAAAAEQSEVLAALMTPGKATVAPLSDQDGHSVATVVARDGQVQVVTHGLSRNDATDSTYVVWGIGRDAGPVALGTFDVVRSQMDLRTVGSEQTGLDDFSGYGISLEPGRRAPAKPTDVVANG